MPKTGKGENGGGGTRTEKSTAASHCRPGMAYSRRSTDPIRIQFRRLSQKTVSAVTRRLSARPACAASAGFSFCAWEPSSPRAMLRQALCHYIRLRAARAALTYFITWRRGTTVSQKVGASAPCGARLRWLTRRMLDPSSSPSRDNRPTAGVTGWQSQDSKLTNAAF